MKQHSKLPANSNLEQLSCGYTRPRQIFTDEEEDALAKYVKHAADIYFGLSPKEVRKLALGCAIEYQKKIPVSWVGNEMAGNGWFCAFLKRNSSISIRTPEATSIARAMSFNKQNVENFKKLAEVFDRTKFQGYEIWNMDETGVTTVVKPSKVVATKGVKQIGAVTSGERGTLVTVAVAVSASGNSILPMFIFPRLQFKDHFIRDGPPGCIGAGNNSGWMTEYDFLTFMQHFVKNTRSSKDSPVLLLLDNHVSHISINIINYARDHGVVMLSFPPHCSHRLQPLDRSVYGPFKRYVSTGQNMWMRNNPGKRMTIYDIPSIVKQALPLAVTPVNITSGFKACGIYPFNSEIFQESDFSGSIPTDRPLSFASDHMYSHPPSTQLNSSAGSIYVIIF